MNLEEHFKLDGLWRKPCQGFGQNRSKEKRLCHGTGQKFTTGKCQPAFAVS
jgi:hypothetical protein